MTYAIRLPDGTLVENIPDEVTPEEAAAKIRELYPDRLKPAKEAAPAAPEEPKQSSILGEAARGFKQFISSGRAGIESLFGTPEEAAIAGVKRGEAIGEEYGEGPSLEAIKRAYEQRGLLPAAGEALSQIPRALAGQGTQIGATIAGGRIGAMAGAPFGPVGSVVGGTVGAGLSMLPSMYGSMIERQAKEDIERGEPVSIDTTAAGLGAAGSVALESAGLGLTLGKRVVKGILGIADDAALASERAAQELVKTASRTLAGGVARGALVEMPVEIAQSVIERAQAGLDLTSPEALKEYGEAAYLAGLVGGPLGGLGRAVDRSGARSELARKESEERQAASQQAAEAQAAQEAQLAQEQTQQAVMEEQQKRMARLPEGRQGMLFPAAEIPRMPPPAPTTPPAPEPPDFAQIETDLRDLKDQRDRVKMYQTQARDAGDTIGVQESQKVLNVLNRKIFPLQRQFDAFVAQSDRGAQQQFTGYGFELETPAPRYTKQGELDLGEPPAPPPEQPPMTGPRKRGDKQLGLFDEPTTPAASAAPTSTATPAAQWTPASFAKDIVAGVKFTSPEAVQFYQNNASEIEKELKILQGAKPTTPAAPELRPGAITLADVGKVNPSLIPWFKKNIEGKTPDEVRAMVDADPSLAVGNTAKAKLVRTLIVPESTPYQEPTDAGVRTEGTGVESSAERETGQRGLEFDIPTGRGQPAEFGEPPVTAGAPAAVEPGGLDVAEQPTGVRNEPEGKAAPAVEAPVEEAPIISFRTAKGSTYDIDEEGRTTRTKAARPEHPGEGGIQPKSQRTIYVRDDDLGKLDLVQTRGPVRYGFVFSPKSNQVAVKALDGPAKGFPVKNSVVTFSTTPAEGLIPVEYWGDDKTIHFGNKITEVFRKPKPVEVSTDGTKAAETVETEAEGRASEQEPPAAGVTPAGESTAPWPIAPKKREPETEPAKPAKKPRAKKAKAEAPAEEPEVEETEEETPARKELYKKAARAHAGGVWGQYAPEDVKFSDITEEGQDVWAAAVAEGKPSIAAAEAIADLYKRGAKAAPKKTVVRAKADEEAEAKEKAAQAEAETAADAKAKKEAAAEEELSDYEKAAKYPDGPFTGADSNVVATKSLNPRLAEYVRAMTKKLGLGNVRILMFSNVKDFKDSALRMHGNYNVYDFARINITKRDLGAKFRFTNTNDFAIYVQEGLSESAAVEAVAHELGHIIQDVAFESAPKDLQAAIRADFDAWFEKTKGYTSKKLVESAYTPSTAELVEVPAGNTPEFDEYVRSFREWFANNVARWAVTDKKAVTIVDKFFKAVAEKFKQFVRLLSADRYMPAQSVVDFLNRMGPDTDVTPPTGVMPTIDIDRLYVPDNITRTSELYEPKPTAVTRAIRSVAGEAAAAEGTDSITRFRTINVDASASVAKKISAAFDGKLYDAMGRINPLPQLRQANDYGKLLISLFENGAIVKLPNGTYEAQRVTVKNAEGKDVPLASAKDAFDLLAKWAKDNKLPFEDAKNELSKMLEARRLDYFRRHPELGVPLHKLSNRDPRSVNAQIDTMLAKFNAEPQLKQVAEMLQKMRERLVQQMYEAGRISEADRDTWIEAVEYIPFDRMEEFATKFKSSRRVGRGLASLGNLPEIIGSERRETQNVLDSQIKNYGWMLGQILNNDAANATLKTLQRIGAAQYRGRNSQVAPEHKVRVYQDGEEVFYELPSRWDVKAFTALNLPKSWAVQQMGNFSNMLRTTVTALPPFALKQVTDDIQRAFVLSGVKNPYALIFPILRNFLAVAWYEITGRRHPLLSQMGRKGVVGEYDFDYRDPSVAILQDFGYVKRPWFKELVHRMEGITRASDLAVRAAIYDRVKKETGDELLATTKAREFINFRRRGAGQLIGTATATIPFFNAYVQSMDLLYRNATGTDVQSAEGRGVAKRMFIAQLAKLAAFAAIYAMAVEDDDDYKGMDLRMRNSNWIIPGLGKLAVPNELAAITKVPVEMTLEYLKRQGTKEEMEAADATLKVLSYAFEQFGGRVVPIPTAIRPVIEAITNYSFLGNRPLEGIYQRNLDPEQRTTPTTSELAKTIGQASKSLLGVGVSPIMVDNFLNQWFGTTAGTVTMLADGVLNPDKMDRPLHKYFLLSNYMYDPVPGRGRTEAYDLREKFGTKNTTLLKLAKEDPDAALRYAEANQKELILGKFANALMEKYEQTRKFKAFVESPQGAKAYGKEEREKALEEVKRMEHEIGLQVREFETMIRKDPALR